MINDFVIFYLFMEIARSPIFTCIKVNGNEIISSVRMLSVCFTCQVN